MNLSKDVKPISYFKANTAAVIKQLNDTRGTMVLTQHGEAKAVLQDVVEYERNQEAMALLQMVVQGIKDFQDGKTISAEDMFAELDAI